MNKCICSGGEINCLGSNSWQRLAAERLAARISSLPVRFTLLVALSPICCSTTLSERLFARARHFHQST